MKYILVTGGAGYIGSHMVRLLAQEGFHPIILDNLSTGHHTAVTAGTFVRGDISDTALIHDLMHRYACEGVIHFASSILVGESMRNPALYYENNVKNTITFLNALMQHSLGYFIFSSSAAIFGHPEYTPIDEQHPKNPVSPYGSSKQICETILEHYAHRYGFKYGALRYFNAAGADPSGKIGEQHPEETHLIPLLLEVALGKRKSIPCFGDDYPTVDGTCVRDYIHVNDLCQAHLKLLGYLSAEGREQCFNLGTGSGYSVREIIEYVQKVTGKKIPVEVLPRRPGDPAILVANGNKAKKLLAWNPVRSDIETIIEDAWRWSRNFTLR